MSNDIGVDVVVENEEGSVDLVSDVLKGDKGDKGDPTATIEINEIITGNAGTDAEIENIGTDVNLKLNITIPRGDKGEKGDIPVKGDDYFTEKEIQDIKEDVLVDVDEKIGNIQALPSGGTKGQVLTKQSETEGDAEWEDIEANEVYIGKLEEAPSSAKMVIEEDDMGESASLEKSEIYVGADEPVAGEKVWFKKGKNLFNANGSNLSYKSRSEKETYTINGNNSITVNGIECTWTRTEITISNLKPNTKYTLSATVTNESKCKAGLVCDNGNNSVNHISDYENFTCKITFVSDEEGKVSIQFFANYTSTLTTNTVIFDNIQLEQGSTETPYEDYIEPQIYVRNSNGEYEKFM